jgi:hypothetical protein
MRYDVLFGDVPPAQRRNHRARRRNGVDVIKGTLANAFGCLGGYIVESAAPVEQCQITAVGPQRREYARCGRLSDLRMNVSANWYCGPVLIPRRR